MIATATKATSGYKSTLSQILEDGYRLTNYGHGLRYFARDRAYGKCDVVAINRGGKIVAAEVQ